MPDTSSIHFTIVDGRRQPLDGNTQVLVRLLNGAKQFDGWWAKGGDIRVKDIEYTDTGRDAYNVFAHADGFRDAVTPNRVPLKRNAETEVALMAIPNGGEFHFLPWQEFLQADSRIVKLVKNGPGDPAQRYSDAMEKRNRQLGALLTLGT